MKKIILLLAVVLIASIATQAQTYLKLSRGTAADTLIESTTFSKSFNISAKETPTVSVQIAVDSVSGTPSGTATLYKSLDGINYETTGQAVTFTTGVDTIFTLTDTTFYGVYGRVDIVGTATTQKSIITETMKSWNKR